MNSGDYPRSAPRVEYDTIRAIAFFQGYGGFTEQAMSFRQAQAIATALGAQFTAHNGAPRPDAEAERLRASLLD